MQDSGQNLARVLSYYNLIKSISDTKIICPFHNDPNPSMSVNYQTGVCFCFGCQTMANAFTIVKMMERKYHHLDDLQAYLKYLRILKSDRYSNICVNPDPKVCKKQKKESYDIAYDYYHGLPKIDWKNAKEPEVREIKAYMLNRGFSGEVLNQIGARITYDKNYMIIFPLLDNGKFRGWVRRTNIPEVEKKRKYLYNAGFSRTNTLAGDYGAKNYVFLVEGYMDRLKFLQYGIKNCAAILGWKITVQQVDKLKAAGITKVISALDNDDCGRRGTKYLNNFFDVTRFCYLKGVKDPGEMSEQSFTKMYNKTMDIFGG